MKTEVVSKDNLSYLVEIIKKNGIIAFPTETVYGLGIIYDSKEALEKLKVAKKRPEDKPFTLMVSNVEQIEEFAKVDEKALKIIKHFMPGPLTMILSKKDEVEDDITNGFKTIGVRMPKDDFVLSLIDKVGKPLLVPSANISGEPPATSTKEVLDQLSGSIDCVVDGHSGSELASTIVDVTKEEIKIIRQGKITKEEIMEVLQ